jgi:predicted enzyme related to lactoylglutathione lyase
MKHVNTIVLVADIERSKAFYHKTIGLEIDRDWGSMVIFKGHFAIHQADKLQPEKLVGGTLRAGNQGAGNLVLFFETDRLEAEFERLRDLGCRCLHGIEALPWQRLFRIFDPDGHIIEIGESQT